MNILISVYIDSEQVIKFKVLYLAQKRLKLFETFMTFYTHPIQ